MFDPFHVAGHNILSTELTAFPVLSSLEPAHSLADMFIDLINTKDKAALPALLMMGAIDTIFHEVVDDFPEIDPAHALLAADEDFALPE